METGIDPQELQRIIATALAEDIGAGDITSQLTIAADAQAEMALIICEPMVVCGTFIPEAVFRQLKQEVQIQIKAEEGRYVEKETPFITIGGNARALLAAERVILNFMQRMSGVATLTRRYIDAIRGAKAVILDTRKTMPGLRMLDKYAVRAGGGQNHRLRLDDMVLIKDNHIVPGGGIAEAVRKARAGTPLPVEVECDTLAQVQEALAAKPDRIMLDNMSVEDMRKAVALVKGAIPLEASGGVSLETVKAIADTGVDYISIGKLTHSAPAADIRADIISRF